MASRKHGGITAGEFFAEKFAGGSMTDAQRETGLGYTTIRGVAAGDNPESRVVGLVRQLADWSRTVAAAKERGVWISVVKTLGLEDVA